MPTTDPEPSFSTARVSLTLRPTAIVKDEPQGDNSPEAATTQSRGRQEEAMVGTSDLRYPDDESDNSEATPTPSLLHEGRSALVPVQPVVAASQIQAGLSMNKPVHNH